MYELNNIILITIMRNTPLAIVRIIAISYLSSMCVKWGKLNSTYYKDLNGVCQCGVLSTKLFAIFK